MVSTGVIVVIGAAVAGTGVFVVTTYLARAKPVGVATQMVTTVNPAGTYAPGAAVGFQGVLRDALTMIGVPNQMVSLVGQVTGVSDVTDGSGSWALSFAAPTIPGTYSVYGYYGGG